MNSYNPLNTGSSTLNSVDTMSRDPLVNDILGNAYQVVLAVYKGLGQLKELHEFLEQYGLTTNVAVKAPVQLVSTEPVNLTGNQVISWKAASGEYTVNGLTGMRVLVLGQEDRTQNGIYVIQDLAWTRAVDFDGKLDTVHGTLVFSTNGDSWQLISPTYQVDIGKTPIEFRDIDLFAQKSVTQSVAAAAAALESEIKAKASEVAAKASELAAQHSAGIAEQASQTAQSSSAASVAAADTSRTVLDQVQAISASVGIVKDIPEGLSKTTNGQYFTVGNGVNSEAASTTYRNESGTAVPVFSSVGVAAYTNLSNKLLSVVAQEDYGNAMAGFIDNNSNSPLFINQDGYVVVNNINFFDKVKELLDKINAFYAYFHTTESNDYIQEAGFIDDNGKLPLYIDAYGDIWLGDGPVNLNQFVRDFRSLQTKLKDLNHEIYGSGNIICDGDSLTAGAGSAIGQGYVERLRARLKPQGITVTKRAVGGQGAQAIATRQGGYVNLITVENNIIPAAVQPVNIVASTQTPITNQGGGPIKGTLNGIEGTIAATFSGTARLTFTFTRSSPGTEDTYIDPATPFIKKADGHEYDIDIIWLGRNNTSSPDLTKICLDAIAACVKHLKAKNKRFVVMSILNGEYPNEYSGGTVYQRIIDTNNAIKEAYPENYLEVRGPLVRSYNPELEQDVLDFSHDIVPASLRNDSIHLNDAGYTILEELVYNFIKNKGWVS